MNVKTSRGNYRQIMIGKDDLQSVFSFIKNWWLVANLIQT